MVFFFFKFWVKLEGSINAKVGIIMHMSILG